jgi:hypothetical protein
VARGDLGIDREIELAEMTALPPLPEVIADVDGFGPAAVRGDMSVHDGKTSMRISWLPLPST